DEVVEILVGELHVALHAVADDRLAVLRRLDADHRLYADRRVGRIAVAPAAVITRRPALGPGLLAHLGEFLLRSVAVIGLAEPDQLLGYLAVALAARELRDRFALPVQAKPGKPVQDRRGRGFSRAL